MVIHKVLGKTQILSAFILFLVLNVLSGGGHLDWRDGVDTFIVAESMIVKGSNDTFGCAKC